eukprot:gene2349-2038_t
MSNRSLGQKLAEARPATNVSQNQLEKLGKTAKSRIGLSK